HLPAALAVLLCRLARRVEHVGRNAADAFLIDHDGKRLGRIEQVLGEAAAGARQLFLDGGEARLFLRRQLGAAQAKVAQRILDDALSRLGQGGKLRRGGERLVLVEQCLVLAELGPVLRDLRQVGVVHIAQLRAVEHGVQVRHLAPGAADAFVRILERRDEAFPGHQRTRDALDGGAAFGEQLVDRRRDVLGFELRESRQSGEVQEWIHLAAPAARKQFSRSMAIVIGPTPPGTGVMAPATSAAEAKSTSPASEPSRSRLTPTSMTQAPGLTIRPVTSFARPTAATSMSALRATFSRSRVFEWQMVTVASFCNRSSASGLPTMFERPMTTAWLPAIGMPPCSSRRITPAG